MVTILVLALLLGSTTPLTTSAQSDDPPAKPIGLSTLAGDTKVKLTWDPPGDGSPAITSYQLWQLAQNSKLTADITLENQFGYSVAVDGDTAVIGVYGDGVPDSLDTLVANAGSAYVFTRNTGTGLWSEAAMLTASVPTENDHFGISVAIDGDTVVVGAHQLDYELNNIVASRSGAAYVFTRPSGGWATATETAKLTPGTAGAADDRFGVSVAVRGDTVVVGAHQHDANAGAAYVFTKPSGSAWVSTSTAAKLTASDSAASDQFGISVAVDGETDGDTVVVGASQGDSADAGGNSVTDSGAAYVYTKPGTGWADSSAETAKLTASDGAASDEFGISVAVDDDTVVVGASGDDGKGSVYVYTKPSGSAWADSSAETAKLTASDGAANDEFGISVAVDGETDGDTIVVGAHLHDVAPLGGTAVADAGAAYVFTKPVGPWASTSTAAKLTASDRAANDEFGSSVAVDGDTVMVGVYSHDNGDSNTANSGAVYVFGSWTSIAGSSAAGTTAHLVTGLTNDTTYVFRLRGVNAIEASDPSDSVAGTPKAASYAPARLLNFSATQTGEGEVELTWDAHRYPLSVTGYAFRQNDGSSWQAISGSDYGTVSHTVTNLDTGNYTFAVSAVNSTFDSVTYEGIRASESRPVAVVDKPAAPDSFSAVGSDEQVWLGWRSPADFTISKYEYQQKTGGDFGNDWTSIPGSRSGTTFHIVTGLTNGTSYTFRVRAFNAAGGSDSSGEQSATPATASSAPVKPEGFAASQTSVGQVELTWDPSSNPLTVTGYEFTQNNGSTWTTISGSDHSTVSHTLNNLNSGNYTFAIRAVNGPYVGDSSGAQSLAVVAKPAAPTGLTINDPEPGSGTESDIGDTQVRLTWNDPGNTSITKYQVLQFPESIKLISSDHDGGDELGWSVAVDGDTLVIGALGDNPGNAGAAYVFTRVGGDWTQAGKLTASSRGSDEGFGSSVAVHGDTIVVGAYEDNIIADDAGAAYVFTKPANGWADMTQTARLTASDAEANDEFGTSVAVHGDTIVVGAPEEDTGARGSAYIFTRPADGWGNWSTLDDDGKAGLTATLIGQSGGDRFGRSVDLHGDTVVVGAHEVGVDDQGEAYVFTKSAATGVWDDWDDKKANKATARLTASDRAKSDKFGWAVAMDGDTIVVGALFNDYDDTDGDTDDDEGAAYVFTEPTGGWGGWNSLTDLAKDDLTAKLIASDRAENDEFGISVAVDGNTVVVGAHQDDSRRGSVYVFTKPATGWTNTAGTDKLTAYDRRGNDRFGNSVAIDGDTVLVGAPYDDNSGSAYVFGTEAAWADIPGSDAVTVSHISTRLPNGAEHTFRVRAVNAAGAGAASNSVLATPKAAEAAPAAPATPSAAQTGVSQVELEWDEVTDATRLTVTGFDYTQDGTTWTSIDGSDSATNSHTVTDLSTGTTYTFAIRAKNSAGAGTSSANSDNVTLVALPAAPTGFSADAGDTQVSLGWDKPAADSPAKSKYQLLQFEPNKLIDDNVLQDDNFGYSVAVDGDTAVIGVYQDHLPGAGGDSFENAGSAYVFVRQANSGGWRQVAHLTASDPAPHDEFGYSVDVDGDTIVVGAHLADHDPGDGTNAADAGAAYVFVKPGTGWADGNETAMLTAYSRVARDEFGISVAVDGDTILVGAHQDDHNGTDAGAAYLFTRPYTGWADSNETTKLIPADGAAGDEFGISVAVDGDTAVIGANKDDIDIDGDDTDETDVGSAYVFTKVSGVWSQRAKLTAFDGAEDDEFGISVAVDDDTIVVGARQDITRNGAAYVFVKPDSGWANGTETAKLTASDGAASDEFGISVAVDGDTIVVGANKDDDNGDDSGSAYVFVKPDTGWGDGTETAKFTAPDGAAGDRYGHSVGASGDKVLVGAPSFNSTDDSGGTVADTGSAYLLRVSDWTDVSDIVTDSEANTVASDVSGLTNGVEYTFQIRGVNDAGPGAASDDSSGTPRLSPPAAPTGLLAEPGDEQVELSWDDPDDPSITHYQYQVDSGVDSGAWTDVPGNHADTTSHVVTDLTNDQEHAFQVRAVNAGGESDPAVQTATPVARSTAPYKPTGFSAEQTGEGLVELRWEAPTDPLTVTGYKLIQDDLSRQDDAPDWTAIPESDSATVSYTVSGLTEEIEYSFAVRAVNNAVDSNGVAIGTSDSSDEVTVTLVAKPNTPTSLNADAGDTQVTVKWGDNNDPLITAYQLLQLPETKLTVENGAADDEFGASVAIDGDTAVVGAYRGGDGVVYVFVRDAQGVWRQAGTLTASDGATDDKFGTAVAVDGDTVVVGAPGDDSDIDGDLVDETDVGSAYLFTKPVSGWETAPETAKLVASDGAANDEFGISIAVSGNIVVVGARGDDTDNGIVYVFAKPTTSNGWADWADTSGDETAKLTASDGAANDELGISVAIDGVTVVAGAHLHDIDDNGSSILNTGAAYVFVRPGTGWATGNQTAKLTASDRAANDEFGTSVGVDGDTIVVGAPGDESGEGSAYVFAKPKNGDWATSTETAKLSASDGAAGDEFGTSVAVDGATIVVGSWGEDEGYTGVAVTNAGGAYVFALESGVWSEELDLFAYDGNTRNHFGWSVAVAGETVLVGSPGDNNASRVESAYLIDVADWADLDRGDMSVSEPDDGGRRDYSRRVTGLTNDQLYVYRVRAVNAAGNTPSREIRPATPMLSKPGKPTGLTAAAGNRRVTLSWDDPRDSSLTGYQVLQPTEQIKLTAGSDGETGGEFGESVAVDDGTAVVGAPEHDGTDSGGNAITDAGAAYVFTRNPNSGAWSDPIELTAGSDGATNDWFGYSVAVDGDTIVVGAYQPSYQVDGVTIERPGAAYVFTKDPLTGEWSAPIKLIASDGVADDWFGHSVAVDGDTIVVGAYKDDDNGDQSGSAYIFTKPSGGWKNWGSLKDSAKAELTAKLTASGGATFDYFGHSVAVDRDTIVVGAYLHDAGAAYVFTRDSDSGEWGETPVSGTHRIETVKLTAADDGDQFGHSVAVDGNTVVVGARKNNAAYVFVFIPDSGAWSEAAKLAASDSDKSEEFGSSVAVRDRTIVVGADYANIDVCEEVDQDGKCEDNFRSGAAYLFTKPANVDWSNDPNKDYRTESDKLILPTDERERGDEFGNSVALDGQSIVVGAPQDDDEFGSVYVSDIPMWAFLASGAETTSATVGGLTNGVEYTFQVRAVDYVGMGPGSDSVRARPRSSGRRDPNRPPSFRGVSSLAFTVAEDTPPGTLVGSAVTATDADGDVLTYSLSGTDASSFGIDSSTGQLFLKDPLDYENKSIYEITIRVSDDNNASVDVDVTITISDVDEAGTVSLFLEQPEVGTPLFVSLSDPDGLVSDISWQWARSSDGSDWSDISGADSSVYTPVADDAGSYFRATASYVDRFGSGKSAHVVTRLPITQRGPSFEGDVTLTVDENTPPSGLVGDAITATDPESDILTYSMWGNDTAFFVIDGSTGQITVGSGTLLDYESGPTRFEVIVSVHDGRDAYGNDDAMVDDFIEVSIDLSNVDEAGTVSVSLEQPEIGTALVVSLSDPDGSLSDISWQWARSMDGSDWSDVSGANSDSYVPVAVDVGSYLRATASYRDGHGPGKTAHAVMESQTAQRAPSFDGDVTLSVDENTPPGSLVGDAITATDPDGDILTYSMWGNDAAFFVIDGATGQITVGSGTLLDYETGPTRYAVIVSVHDGGDAYGKVDTEVDDFVEVSIDVSNVDEAGTVLVSLEQPEVGTALVVSLSDPDGSLSDISWQWARSSDGTDWQDIAGASFSNYTPVDLDADKYLRVTVTYADSEGSGKQAQAVLNNPVQRLPEPVATPMTTATTTATATETPAPELTPTPTLTAPTPTPTMEPAPSPTPTTEPAPSEADGGDGGFPWWAIVAVVIGVVAGVVLTIVVLRSRR